MSNMQVRERDEGGRLKRWLDNIRDDTKDYEMTKDMAQSRSV